MNNVYLIAYELRNPDSIKNQDSIANAIKSISGDWWHHLGSVWLVAGNELSAYEIGRKVGPYFKTTGANPEDSFFIVKLDLESPDPVVAGFLPKPAWDWLRSKRTGAALPTVPPKAQAER